MQMQTRISLPVAALALSILTLGVVLFAAHQSNHSAELLNRATQPQSQQPPLHFNVGGKDVVLGPTDSLTFHDTTTTTSSGGKTDSHVKVGAAGPSVSSDNPDALKIHFEAPSATLPDGGGSLGGGGDIAGTFQRIEKPTTIFYIIGSIVIIGAGIFWWITRDLRDAILIAALGGGFIGIGIVVNEYPWVGLLGLLLGVALLALWLYRANKSTAAKDDAQAKTDALSNTIKGITPIVKAIEDLPDAIQATVKERIAAHAGADVPTVDAVVNPIKATLP